MTVDAKIGHLANNNFVQDLPLKHSLTLVIEPFCIAS